jgi:hypothetical protein
VGVSAALNRTDVVLSAAKCSLRLCLPYGIQMQSYLRDDFAPLARPRPVNPVASALAKWRVQMAAAFTRHFILLSPRI